MSAIGTRYYTPNPFEVDDNGVPLAAARLFFYQTGTDTPLDTYADVGLTVPNPNPITADANGRFGTIFMVPSTAYKVQLWTAATDGDPVGAQIWTEDPCGPAAGGSSVQLTGIIGEIKAFAGPDAAVPSLWLLCFGQAISRADYASLFAVLGTTWGAGDGGTTFNVPDLRGRSLFGRDNMGGAAANRLTAGVSGVAGATLGASGGDQATQDHTHTLNDPQHTHGLTDPGHTHQATSDFSALFTAATHFGVLNTSAPGGAPTGNEYTKSATTGATVDSASTGITSASYGDGTAQNVPPAAVVNFIIYAGA